MDFWNLFQFCSFLVVVERIYHVIYKIVMSLQGCYYCRPSNYDIDCIIYIFLQCRVISLSTLHTVFLLHISISYKDMLLGKTIRIFVPSYFTEGKGISKLFNLTLFTHLFIVVPISVIIPYTGLVQGIIVLYIWL